MNLSKLFINRPVATTLLMLGIVLAGMIGFKLLAVAPLPQVDYPTISVSANLPGASPETMAATVATPLERAFGRIAGVTEMTSSSSLGSTRVTLQFDLDRDIDGAARDVQAAINAAKALLPTSLPSNPSYRKVNPSDSPIMILALTSQTMSQGQMYDFASSVIAQKLLQISGVGDVNVGGSSLPAVRVELNPDALAHQGVSLDSVRQAINQANVNRPKGSVEEGERRWQILANDQAKKAADYMPLIVHYQNGAAVRLSDVANVRDAVENSRNAGSANGKPSVLLIITRAPGANIIDTVDRIRAELPNLQASLPGSVDMSVQMDRSPTIRASLAEVEQTLLIAVALVILVVYLFIGNARATLIPAIVVPVSLVGSFAAMYLLGYSLNNLSLMALIIATGFVVDDAIVVLENVARHIEGGMEPFAAALQGAREVGFTVLSMSISLVAVFIPLLLMGGLPGRLFQEFAVTLSVAILISMVVSLSMTPMMCARLLRADDHTRKPNWLIRRFGQVFDAVQRGYAATLSWALRHSLLTVLILIITVMLNVHLYRTIPKGFFPEQDIGRISGFIQADQSISFQAMKLKMQHFIDIVRADPAVDTVTAFTGGRGGTNSGSMFISLKPRAERPPAQVVIARLRGQLAHEPGARLFMVPNQDIRIGGRQGNASYQFTLQGDDLQTLRTWEPKIREALSGMPLLTDVNTDQQDRGVETALEVDRDAASRLGLTAKDIDNVLNNAFGQRQVSNIYSTLNQYHVVMEVAPQYAQSPQALEKLFVIGPNGAQVPLSAFAHWAPAFTPLSVNHQGQFAATTISFNLAPGVSLSQATDAINNEMARLGVPTSVQGSFAGTAKAFQSSVSNQPLLILAAIIAVYIVLGILYESLVHPLTILSTLPSAGIGALLALMISNTDFSLIALVGVLLLIGIVKKNAIMMIDFALDAERNEGLSSRDAIYKACLLRFRPILMTTMAALFGALPLMLAHGDGAELRQPLGIAIVGGLVMSQLLTLYTTPVVYLYLDRLRLWGSRQWAGLYRRKEA
ncbi:multidrug efflux RND transporter permease subunit [Jeongeupia naejangsanensis]|uniref:Multidrug efflux RND transporter permease subunit n=1 Tax=Jeongeupia naejangsanensis TaxID=613195 RepID=A0ABS2BKU9_9NEIS|nr:multidrug efflux RND transporter permease subunit [Jeongeupia naejangsanensis]MBM3116231.1 multidrug efflux RND transporter permease subunit [Jeongeupia naejangsanensis]